MGLSLAKSRAPLGLMWSAACDRDRKDMLSVRKEEVSCFFSALQEVPSPLGRGIGVGEHHSGTPGREPLP